MKFEKYQKNAKPGEPSSENPLMIIGKILMCAVYAWSGFFWAGVTIYNFYVLTPDYSHLATCFLIGTLFVLAGIILCWMKKYILQFPFICIGVILFMVATGEMIDVAESTAVIFTPSFELRYLPILAVWLVSLIFFIVKGFILINNKKHIKDEFNNSPAKSILDD